MIEPNRIRTVCRPLRAAAVLVALALCAQSAAGLDIVFLWDTGSDPSPRDPGGIGLFTVAAPAVEELWESIILDPVTVTIILRYRNIPNDALMNASADAISGGHPILGHVNADPDPDFHFELSPLDSTDFSLTQTTFHDLTTAEKFMWYNTTGPNTLPPHGLEVRYGGWLNTGGMAEDDYDAFTVLAHEVGHVLGLSTSMAYGETVGEGDYDYDLPFLRGVPAAVKTEGTDPDDVNSYCHLATPSLMAPGIARGYRMFPSATDILAIAATGNWTDLALPRMDYLGGGIFSDGYNWPGGKTPTPFTEVWVRKGNSPPPFAVAQSTMFFRNLRILDGSWVTSDHPLNVEETTVIGGTDADGGDSRVRVQSNGSLETTDLSVRSEGVVQLIGGFLDVDNEAEIDPAGGLRGYGTVFIREYMNNHGRIVADGGHLLLSTTSPVTKEIWRLDGDGGGTVEAVDGDITIYGSHVGWFDGTMLIGQGRYIAMNREWTLNDEGLLQFTGVEGAPARLTGTGLKIIQGELTVNGEGEIASPMRFVEKVNYGTAEVRVIQASDRLTLTGPATFQGGRFYGGGTLVQASDFTVETPTVITTHTFDWGNSDLGQSNDILVDDTDFEVRSARTGTPDNEYRGVITLLEATLEVNTDDPWTLPVAEPGGDVAPALPEGKLVFNSHKGPCALEGQQLTVGGTVQAVGGYSAVDAPFVTTPTATVTVFPAAQMDLLQHTTFNGGTVSGGGSIRQIGNARVVGSTDIDTSTYDWDGKDATPSQTTIDSGKALRISSSSIENGGPNVYDGVVNVNGGRLELSGISSWSLGVDGRINLAGGSGSVAVIAGADVKVFGQVDADGPVNEFQTDVIFEPSATVTVSKAGDLLNLAGETTYRGGSYTGLGWIAQGGDAVVEQDTAIDVGTFDMDGLTESTVLTLRADLTLNVDKVDADNTFGGTINARTADTALTVNVPARWIMDGFLFVAPPPDTGFHVAGSLVEHTGVAFVNSQSTLVYDADVTGPGPFNGPGAVMFNGSYNPGTSPGLGIFGGDVAFGPAASLRVELGGTQIGEFDRLSAQGRFTPGGAMAITPLETYVPSLGDRFEIVQAGTGVAGLFDRVDGVLPGNNKAFAVTYGPKTVLIIVAIPGDVELDKDVDFGDFTYVAANYGQSGKSWRDGDVDGSGDVGFADFTYVAANYGSDGDSVSPAKTPSADTVKLHVDVVTGEVWLVGNGVTLSGYSIASAAGSLIPVGDADSETAFPFHLSDLANEIAAAGLGQGVDVAGEFPLDAAYDTAAPMDLEFSYGVFGQGGSQIGQVVVVPEPTCIALLGLGGSAMLRRRKRR